jgi:hypothetical protein
MSDLNLAGDPTLALMWAAVFVMAVVVVAALCWYGWRGR